MQDKDFYSENDRSLLLMKSFWNMQKSIMRYVQKTAAGNNLSVTQYNILMMLIHHNEIPQKAIQEKTHLAKSTLSQAINGLVDEGYLIRQHVEGNRRETMLLICKKGRDLINQIDTQEDGFHKTCQRAVNNLTEKEFKDIIHIHKQIANNFKEEGSDHTC